MIFKYGNYSHPMDEAALTIRQQGNFSSVGTEMLTRQTWTIQGFLQADPTSDNPPASLTTAINELLAAYAIPGQDAGLYFDDGTTPTAHVVNSADTAGGVRVVARPSFPRGEGAEYVSFRWYEITLEFDMFGDATFTEWNETVSFIGGGPRWLYLTCLTGPPVQQLVQEQTTYRAIQSGNAVGLQAYPLPALPIWPLAWHQDQSEISRQAPQTIGDNVGLAQIHFPTSWNYQFESALPLVGNPTPRPT